MSAGQRQAPARHTAVSVHTDEGARSRMRDRVRISLPFQFDRRDIPYVSPHARMAETPALTSASTTHMTAQEQARIEPRENLRQRSTDDQLPTWMEYYQRTHSDWLKADAQSRRLQMTRWISVTNQIFFWIRTPLLDGGREKADRLGPDSSIFETRRSPLVGSGAARRGRHRQDFDN